MKFEFELKSNKDYPTKETWNKIRKQFVMFETTINSAFPSVRFHLKELE